MRRRRCVPSFNVYWILLNSLFGFQYYFCLLCIEWINLVSTWPQKRNSMCQIDLWKRCHSRRKSSGSVRLECFKTDETKSDSHRVRESFRKPASLRRESLKTFEDIPLIQSLRWGAVSGTSLLKVFKNFTFSGLAYLQRLENSDISKSFLCWAGSVFTCEPCWAGYLLVRISAGQDICMRNDNSSAHWNTFPCLGLSIPEKEKEP